MATIREARTAFSGFIETMKGSLRAVDAEALECCKRVQDLNPVLEAQIASLFPDIGSFQRDCLTRAFMQSCSPYNFPAVLQDIQRENVQLERGLKTLAETHGSPVALEVERRGLEDVVTVLPQRIAGYLKQVSRADNEMAPLLGHIGKRATKEGTELDKETLQTVLGHYRNLSFRNFLSPDWHVGRYRLQKYESAYGSFAARYSWRQKISPIIERAQETLLVKQERLQKITDAMNRMAELRNGIKPEAEILKTLRAKMCVAMFERAFLDAMADNIGKEAMVPVAESVLKIDCLNAMVTNLKAVHASVGPGLKTLEVTHRKLQKFSGMAVDRAVAIDLDGIGRDVEEQSSFAQSLTRNASNLRVTLDGYRHDDPLVTRDQKEGEPQSLTACMTARILSFALAAKDRSEIFVGQMLQGVKIPSVATPCPSAVGNREKPRYAGLANFNAIPPANVVTDYLSIPAFTVPEIYFPDLPRDVDVSGTFSSTCSPGMDF